MFSHILVGTNDGTVAKKFYDSVVMTPGITKGELNDEKQQTYFRSPDGSLIITEPTDGNPDSVGNGSSIGFSSIGLKCGSAKKSKSISRSVNCWVTMSVTWMLGACRLDRKTRGRETTFASHAILT